MTSLIDVVFILLIFFMIASRFEKPAIKVDLPNASSGETIDREVLAVTIDAESRVYLEGKPVDPAAFKARIAPRLAQNPELTAALYCDGEVPFQAVVEVMDRLKSAGVRHAAIRHDRQR